MNVTDVELGNKLNHPISNPLDITVDGLKFKNIISSSFSDDTILLIP